MVMVSSTMLPLHSPAPDFTLTDAVTGTTYSLDSFADRRVLVVMFICNHCPFVKHIADELARLSRDYPAQGVAFVAISSNSIESHPADSPELMAAEARAHGYSFPYLYDETQEVAKAYRAACTPDFYVFGPERTLVYRGQLDASRPGNDLPVTGSDLRRAIEHALEGRPPIEKQFPSVGCNIKWKPGNAPDYFGA